MSSDTQDGEMIVDKFKIEEDNKGAQLFFAQIINMFDAGLAEFTVDYDRDIGASGKLKVTITEVE